ncbi:GH17606 [Drosophila grimshawi]|uniref:GH17606 n=1 Tax=Drosophila grimshawi TaxID=7222 RepID=B4JXA2_DROGR|nr:GH17606 [Drosophila grimshawi]
MATHGTPMTPPSTLYHRPSSSGGGGVAGTPITVSLHYPFAAGAVQNGAERSRLLELLRAPNNLTSPTLEPSSKGLLNGPGQNNCFLNCAVQLKTVNNQSKTLLAA